MPSTAQTSTPVFVFPSQLDFYVDDKTTHKRVMTIYNPYDVDVTFKGNCERLQTFLSFDRCQFDLVSHANALIYC